MTGDMIQDPTILFLSMFIVIMLICFPDWGYICGRMRQYQAPEIDFDNDLDESYYSV